MFTANKFKNHIWKVVEKNSDKVIDLLKASQGETVDFFNLMNRFTLDSIGEIAFAKSIGSLEDASSPFLRSFDRAQQVLFTRFVVPGWQLLRLLGLATEWGARSHFRLLREYSSKIVRELRNKLDGETGDSFVGLFLKAAEGQGMPTDDRFMADAVLNFLIAGRDTTAQAMSWCMFLIAQNPEVEAKILQEAESVLDGAASLSYDQLSKLPYLDATIREALRLYPSVPMDVKLCLRDDTLPDGTFVPAGCSVAYFAYGMGRSRRIWGEDAKEFRPERWLSMAAPPDSYTYSAFHAGPRECLGKRLAMVEMKTLLFKVLRAFKLTLAVAPEEVKPDVQLTLGMSSGLPLRVAAR